MKLLVLCAALMGVMGQPASKPLHELKVQEYTPAHLRDLMADTARVNTLTGCLLNPTSCRSRDSKSLGAELSALGVGGSCLTCSPIEQEHVFALLKSFAETYQKNYPEQFASISKTPLMQKLLQAPKGTHELHMTEYSPSHLAGLMAAPNRIQGVTECFQDLASCSSAEGKNLVGQLSALVAGGGECTSCTPRQKAHINSMLEAFVRAYKAQYPEQFAVVLPKIASLLN